METKVQKWGNSLALRIPKPFADNLRIGENSRVELELADGKLVVSPDRPLKYSLRDLLAGVTDENIHHEVQTGPPVGEEVW